jgi:hypothetical protein
MEQAVFSAFLGGSVIHEIAPDLNGSLVFPERKA